MHILFRDYLNMAEWVPSNKDEVDSVQSLHRQNFEGRRLQIIIGVIFELAIRYQLDPHLLVRGKHSADCSRKETVVTIHIPGAGKGAGIDSTRSAVRGVFTR